MLKYSCFGVENVDIDLLFLLVLYLMLDKEHVLTFSNWYNNVAEILVDVLIKLHVW